MRKYKIVPLLVVAVGVALLARRHQRHLKWRDPDDWDEWDERDAW